MQATKDKIFNIVLSAFILISIFACGKKGVVSEGLIDGTKVPTITSTDLEITQYQDDGVDYFFKTPLMERYELIDSPYTEFTKGVYLETFNDTTGGVETTIVGNYAKYDETDKIWEARGDVVVTSSEDKTIYTEQIFWNEKERKIYTEVRIKLVQGDEINIGIGFESDDKLQNGIIKIPIGRFALDTTRNETQDTIALEKL